jgi:hypothetical protein
MGDRASCVIDDTNGRCLTGRRVRYEKRRWIQAPCDIEELVGAFFCDRRDDHVFVYYKGEESYYDVREIKAQKLMKDKKQNIERFKKYLSKLRIESKAK